MAPKLQNHFLDFYKKLEFPFHILLYTALIISIIYIPQIPDNIKMYGSNPLYRIIAFILVLVLTLYISPIHGLLLALVVLLYVSFTPGKNEGYQNSLVTARKQKRWFDEEVLEENPVAYQNDKVTTQAPNT